MEENNFKQSTDGLVKNVIDGGYCIGCGACAIKNNDYTIDATEQGFYQARQVESDNQNDVNSICPFSSTNDESQIGEGVFGKNPYFDQRVGYYQQIYAGYVIEKDYCLKGSSGGLVTWVLSELLTSGEIDGVIHVGETGRIGELFEYRISETIDDIKANAKSRYYPVHMDEVIKKVKLSEKKYAFVGVPCFVKAIRLLMGSDPETSTRIKYCIAIFCGHFKTKAFSEMIAWQQGVVPKELAGIDFRVKNRDAPASQYSTLVKAQTDNGGQAKLPSVLTRDLYGMDWGLGYFKPKACDWCDDIAGETADLACGDAWLPEFVKNSGGTNIVVVRNTVIQKMLHKGIESNKLNLKIQSVDKVYESQAGNYRHRQEGLSVRIKEAKIQGHWFPKKRIDEASFSVPAERKKIYLFRSMVAEISHINFLQAKSRKSFIYFMLKMMPYEIKYFWLNRNIKGMVKISYQIFKYMQRRLRK